MYSCADTRKQLEEHLHGAEQRVRDLQEQNKKKTRQIIAVKLQTSTLKYQINRYRNDESGTLDFYLKQNDELRFELTMLKKLRNDEIEHIDSENIDFVGRAHQAKIDNAISEFTLDENAFSANYGSESELSGQKAPKQVSEEVVYFSEKQGHNLLDRDELPRVYSPRDADLVRNIFPKASLASLALAGVVPVSLESKEMEQAAKTQYSTDAMTALAAGDSARRKLLSQTDIFRVASHLAVRLSVDELLRRYARTLGQSESCLLGPRDKLFLTRCMLLSLELASHNKDALISSYRHRLEDTQRKMETFDSVKKKQKDLLKHKEQEVQQLIEQVKAAKLEYMKLLEENNQLQVSLMTRDRRTSDEKLREADKPRKSFFSNITDIF